MAVVGPGSLMLMYRISVRFAPPTGYIWTFWSSGCVYGSMRVYFVSRCSSIFCCSLSHCSSSGYRKIISGCVGVWLLRFGFCSLMVYLAVFLHVFLVVLVPFPLCVLLVFVMLFGFVILALSVSTVYRFLGWALSGFVLFAYLFVWYCCVPWGRFLFSSELCVFVDVGSSGVAFFWRCVVRVGVHQVRGLFPASWSAVGPLFDLFR